MLATLQYYYAQLPHPLLSNSITMLLVYAGVVGMYDAVTGRYSDVSKQVTMQLPSYTGQVIEKLPRVRNTKHSWLFICIVVLAFGMVFGYGFGRTIAGANASIITYHQGNTVIQGYHDNCSDWYYYQQQNK